VNGLLSSVSHVPPSSDHIFSRRRPTRSRGGTIIVGELFDRSARLCSAHCHRPIPYQDRKFMELMIISHGRAEWESSCDNARDSGRIDAFDYHASARCDGDYRAYVSIVFIRIGLSRFAMDIASGASSRNRSETNFGRVEECSLARAISDNSARYI